MPEPLSYAKPIHDAHGSRPFAKVLAVAVYVLIPAQFVWFFGWGLFLATRLPEDAFKQPLADFFVDISIAIPSIAIILLTALVCGIKYRRDASLRGCKALIIISVLALMFVGLIVAAWVVEDVINP